MEDTKKTSRQYSLQVVLIANVLMLLGYGVQYTTVLDTDLLAPLAVAYTFYLLTAGIFIGIWQKTAATNQEMLTSVYMATSGFRMLLALATLTTTYFIVGRENMLPYVVVFMIFYLIAVGHHSFFFARFNNKH